MVRSKFAKQMGGGGLGVGVNVNSFKMVFKDEIMFLNSRLLIFFPLI